MAKSLGLYKVTNNTGQPFSTALTEGTEKEQLMPVVKALAVVLKQLRVAGRRDRTLVEYQKWTERYCEFSEVTYLEQITAESIYNWLESMTVGDSTKLIRLKSLKAVLSHCHSNGWLPVPFWQSINITLDKKVKERAKDKAVAVLLSMLDLTNFFELRDSVAVSLMYKTGIRLATLSKLQEAHIDFTEECLNLPGSIMKNHSSLKLPVDTLTMDLLKALIQQNALIRAHNHRKNSLVFITRTGTRVQTNATNNVIQKRLGKYAKEFCLKNINPHALRRGFATNLLEQGASIPLISKALGHKDLAVTTQYLCLSEEQVAKELRNFLPKYDIERK